MSLIGRLAWGLQCNEKVRFSKIGAKVLGLQLKFLFIFIILFAGKTILTNIMVEKVKM